MVDHDKIPPLCIYFVTTSKEGEATLSVDHTWSHEYLTLPVHPLNAVPTALSLLEPAFAHYVAQWERFMVPDPQETDAVGFFVPAGGMPDHIAPPDNWAALTEISWRYTTPQVMKFLGFRRPDALFVRDANFFIHSNVDDYVVEAAEFGIDMWPGP